MIFSRVEALKKFQVYILPILNFCLFTSLSLISTIGFQKKKIVFIGLIAFVLAIILNKHLKKIMVIQFLMALFLVFKLALTSYTYVSYNADWAKQSDKIEEVVFVNKPNVYIIQPDGYVGFSELKKGHYNFDNSDFEAFLKTNGFKLYSSRSNYYSTLSSNASLFTMKHHKYNMLKYGVDKELFNAREIIVGDNPVVSIFKNNGYKTNLLLEYPYLIANKPKIAYDYCNVNVEELPFLSRGFDVKKELKTDLISAINNSGDQRGFYFIEKMKPGHITHLKQYSQGVEEEKNRYLESLKTANTWLREVIQIINLNDDNALIVIVADHGGFVGMEYTKQTVIKNTERDFLYSIFSTALAIKWPRDAPDYDNLLKSNVNLFRVLFTYLSGDKEYLKYLENDKSYLKIKENAPQGVYEVIDANGEIVFNKLES